MSNDIQTELLLLETQFPKGSVAYHKATGQALVVLGYALSKNNELLVSGDFGNGVPKSIPALSLTDTAPESSHD